MPMYNISNSSQKLDVDDICKWDICKWDNLILLNSNLQSRDNFKILNEQILLFNSVSPQKPWIITSTEWGNKW